MTAMKKTFEFGAGLFSLLALLGLTMQPVSAQDGNRFRVLVPYLQPMEDADDDFGEDVANELRDLIGDMATHEPVSDDALDEALEKFDVDEDDLDCIRARQLAVQLGAELVMCGSYTEPSRDQFQVTASFLNARTGERFDVSEFPSSDDEERAARHIFDEFRTYIEQLRQTAFCLEYLGSGQYQNALQNCESALEANPQSTTARFAVARARLGLAEEQNELGEYVLPEAERQQTYREAMTALQEVLEQNPVHQDALQTAGYVAVKMDQREQALDYYRQYLELNPGAANVRITVATDLANAGDPAGALRLIEEGIELAGEDADPSLYEYAGHFATNAASSVDDATAPGGRTAEELYNIALENYQRVYELRGEETDPALLRRMLLAMSEAGRTEEAVQMGRELVERFPEDAQLLDVYANVLNRAGQRAQAIETLERLAELDPERTVYPRIGLWLARAGEFRRAQQAFEQAIERGEASAEELSEVVFGVGYQQFYQQDRWDPALDAFEVSRELATSQQKQARANFWMGYILYQRAQRIQEPSTPASAREALPLFERALGLFQNSQAYAETAGSGVNLPEIISATEQFIEIQELLIQRG